MEEEDDAPQQPLRCTKCQKEFLTNSLFSQHVNAAACQTARKRKRSTRIIDVSSNEEEYEDKEEGDDEDEDDEEDEVFDEESSFDEKEEEKKSKRRAPPKKQKKKKSTTTASKPAAKKSKTETSTPSIAKVLDDTDDIIAAIDFERTRETTRRLLEGNTQIMENAAETIAIATSNKKSTQVEIDAAKKALEEAEQTYMAADARADRARRLSDDTKDDLDELDNKINAFINMQERLDTFLKNDTEFINNNWNKFRVKATIHVEILNADGTPAVNKSEFEMAEEEMPGCHENRAKLAAKYEELNKVAKELEEEAHKAYTDEEAASTRLGVLSEQYDDWSMQHDNATEKQNKCILEKKRLEDIFYHQSRSDRLLTLKPSVRHYVEQLRSDPSLFNRLATTYESTLRAGTVVFTRRDPFVLTQQVLENPIFPRTMMPSDDVCPICSEKLKKTDEKMTDQLAPVVRTKCGHYYHAECINSMLLRENGAHNALRFQYEMHINCPMCRAKIDTNDLMLVDDKRRYYF